MLSCSAMSLQQMARGAMCATAAPRGSTGAGKLAGVGRGRFRVPGGNGEGGGREVAGGGEDPGDILSRQILSLIFKPFLSPFLFSPGLKRPIGHQAASPAVNK